MKMRRNAGRNCRLVDIYVWHWGCHLTHLTPESIVSMNDDQYNEVGLVCMATGCGRYRHKKHERRSKENVLSDLFHSGEG